MENMNLKNNGNFKDKSELVSIIIPAYNASDLISEALESICSQTYQNWEVIVVEDGTKDRTEEILTQFKERYGGDRIHYIRHSINQGASAARNTGLRTSQGNYIAFLDHDDIWKPYHLEMLISFMKQKMVDFVFAAAEFFHYTTHNKMGFHGPSDEEWSRFPESLLGRNAVPVSGVLMHREVYERVGEFDVQIRGVEDLDYWLRCAEAGIKFAYLPVITNGYRQQSPGAITCNKTRILELHALLLRKHSNIKFANPKTRNMILARYHLGVVRRNLKSNPAKALYFLYCSLRLTPAGTIEAVKWFLLQKISKETPYDYAAGNLQK